MKDFFISYNGADQLWAEWIAWQLEEQGYTTVIQAWDFLAGSSFPVAMQQASKVDGSFLEHGELSAKGIAKNAHSPYFF